jgi:hypothetical protein
METLHLPRFKRVFTAHSIQLTERDHNIIRLVHQHRFLRSSHITAFLAGSSQQLVRRLQLLYHHGFLERPRAQLDYYHKGGSRHIVYGLGSKGADLLRREHGFSFAQVRWGEKNRSVGRVFLEHALLVSEVMVALELACRKEGNIRVLAGAEIPIRGGNSTQLKPFRWRVKIRSGPTLGIVPDRVFALEIGNPADEHNLAFFFLEADRGTMPVVRRSLFQTSFYRKLLAYEATWSQSIHQTRFGFHRFRVLTVTTSPERVKSLLDACSTLKRGHGLFLFTDRASLEKPNAIFSPIWHTPKQARPLSLLE